MPVLRLKNITGPGLVFVTTTAIDWHPVFKPPHIARAIAQQIAETASFLDISIVGYVVMPSHVHLLLGFPEVSLLSKAVQSFKSITSRRLRGMDLSPSEKQIMQSGSFRLWKRRFDDVIITSRMQFKRKLQYIHNNLVKAGLVEEATEWEFSSARSWLMGEVGLIKIDKEYKWI